MTIFTGDHFKRVHEIDRVFLPWHNPSSYTPPDDFSFYSIFDNFRQININYIYTIYIQHILCWEPRSIFRSSLTSEPRNIKRNTHLDCMTRNRQPSKYPASTNLAGHTSITFGCYLSGSIILWVLGEWFPHCQ